MDPKKLALGTTCTVHVGDDDYPGTVVGLGPATAIVAYAGATAVLRRTPGGLVQGARRVGRQSVAFTLG